MAHRKKVGDLYAILLPNNKYAFGRLFQEGSVAFYEYRGKNPNDVPNNEDYEFIVCVHKSCFKEWVFIENRGFKNDEESRPPLYQMKDIFTEKYSIYDFGAMRPSTKEECEGLEICAVWEQEHLLRRLMKDESWKKWFPTFY